MPVRPYQKHRMLRRDGIEFRSGREGGRRPEGLNPAAPDDPFTLGRLGNAGGNGGQKGGAGVGSFQIQGQFAFADAKQVAVGIGEAGVHHGSGQVHKARSGATVGHGFGRGPDENDTPAPDGNGLGPGLPIIEGVHGAVDEQDIGRRRPPRRGGGQSQQYPQQHPWQPPSGRPVGRPAVRHPVRHPVRHTQHFTPVCFYPSSGLAEGNVITRQLRKAQALASASPSPARPNAAVTRHQCARLPASSPPMAIPPRKQTM